MGVRHIGVATAAVCLYAAAAGSAGAAPPASPRAATPFAYTAPAAGSRQLFALSRFRDSLVQVDRSTAAAALLRRHGGTLVSRTLNVWRLRTGAVQALTPQLQRLGVLSVVEPVRGRDFLGRLDVPTDLLQGDPLIPQEWWIHAVGADTSEPPGPGVAITDIDSGLDVTHEEFSARPQTSAMNFQSTTAENEWHGTAVGSVASAPANGLGMVGAYPTSVFRMWDASPGGQLTNDDEIRGINAAAALGPSVINLSIGSEAPDVLERQAVYRAFGSGSLVVAASGNSRSGESNPLEYPAAYPHVLTVAATRPSDGESASWSSSSPFVDLAAPGVQIPIAVPKTADDPSGYETADGTSFAAPIVSGLAAWVSTVRPGMDVTQLSQLMRGTAVDVAPAGRDNNTGYGLVNLPAALAAPIPASDPQEPNDDVFAVKQNGLFHTAKPLLTTLTTRTAKVTARIDLAEDPEDVYRILVPARKTVTVTMAPSADLSLGLWGPKTRTVFESNDNLKRAFLRDFLRSSTRKGKAAEKVVYANKLKAATQLYVDVWIGRGVQPVRNAAYTLSVSSR